MHIIKFIGMYLLTGIALHWGWSIIYEIWILRKVGGERFEEVMHYYVGLKLKLYDKHSGMREAKLFMESLAALGAKGLIFLVLATFFIWPVAFFEDIAVYPEMTEYVLEQSTRREEP